MLCVLDECLSQCSVTDLKSQCNTTVDCVLGECLRQCSVTDLKSNCNTIVVCMLGEVVCLESAGVRNVIDWRDHRGNVTCVFGEGWI